MRLVHEWSNERAKNVVNRFGLLKPYEQKKPVTEKKKDYHGKQQCSIDGCLFAGFQLGRHLKSSAHQMNANDDNYKDALKAARPFVPLTGKNLKEIGEISAREQQREAERQLIEGSRPAKENCSKEIEDNMDLF
uniref:Uncharacterized protein n=1 Tax=Clytia hemisphaerica TaxID=252671 RepID=A0A7M5V0Q4_9CNID